MGNCLFNPFQTMNVSNKKIIAKKCISCETLNKLCCECSYLKKKRYENFGEYLYDKDIHLNLFYKFDGMVIIFGKSFIQLEKNKIDNFIECFLLSEKTIDFLGDIYLFLSKIEASKHLHNSKTLLYKCECNLEYLYWYLKKEYTSYLYWNNKFN